MDIRIRASRRGPNVDDIYVDNEFVGITKPHPRGGKVAIKKTGEVSTVLFHSLDTAAEWLVNR
jgi:hypothetical protein